jgi:hypothetical protein
MKERILLRSQRASLAKALSVALDDLMNVQLISRNG